MGVNHHTIFWASGSKGHNVRANGNGGFLSRGYYFGDKGGLHGPYPNKRAADRALAPVVLKPLHDRQRTETMKREAQEA